MKYDHIIIGAGSAGCVLASRLSEDPDVSILLIEAGPDYSDFESVPDDVKYGNNIWRSAYGNHSWWYPAFPTSDRDAPMIIPRGKVVGGSSSINGQVICRGIPEDYDNQANELARLFIENFNNYGNAVKHLESSGPLNYNEFTI